MLFSPKILSRLSSFILVCSYGYMDMDLIKLERAKWLNRNENDACGTPRSIKVLWFWGTKSSKNLADGTLPHLGPNGHKQNIYLKCSIHVVKFHGTGCVLCTFTNNVERIWFIGLQPILYPPQRQDRRPLGRYLSNLAYSTMIFLELRI